MYEAAFRDLRKLAAWFAGSPSRTPPPIQRTIARLGVLAVPLLGRELAATDPRRREAARDALAAIADHDDAARARVTAALRAIAGGEAPDEAKVVALGLLSDLGAPASARFADPGAIRVRAALALAAHLRTAADVASAAELMRHQLDPDDMIPFVEAMVGAAPTAARRLARELAARLDLDAELRDRAAALAASVARTARGEPSPDEREGAGPREHRDDRDHGDRAVEVAVLVDAAARLMVVAGARDDRGCRRWAVLIGAAGKIDDCLHEDGGAAHSDAASLVALLCGDGYRVASADPARASELVAAAARRTVEAGGALPPAYYLGRDLLALFDAHLGPQALEGIDRGAAALASALELLAAGDHDRAQALLDRCDPDQPDAAAAIAAIALAQGRPAAAMAALDRALAVEPDWPLHHWNAAAALHQLGDTAGCYRALRRFVATSAAPTGLYADPEQPARVGCAERMIAELERAARLAGRPLGRRPRRKRGSSP